MPNLTEQIINQIIIKKSLMNNYPKPGVVFLNLESLFNDPMSRKTVCNAVLDAVKQIPFDYVAGIASRGYLFSGMIANRSANVGEQLIQKVKVKNDSNFVQIDTKTEYSSDALQVLKGSIEKGKRYLLTDDLIATGGSLMTAIKLIRECGGLVDTVFVMTELLDFPAKEGLKKEGVELISLLKFTNQDLNKLLLMQDSYRETPSTPITYKLGHHAQGEQALRQSITSPVLSIHLTSQSSVKKEACQRSLQGIFDPLNIEVIGHDSQSGVNSQPFGYDETRRGAAQRIASIADQTKSVDNPIVVSIENGVRYSEDEKCYYDFVHVILKHGEMEFSHTQDCCKVPTEIMNAISKDSAQCFQETWGDVAKRMNLAKEANNPHQEKFFGGISRTEYLFRALSKTLGALKEKMMESTKSELKDDEFNIRRLININHHDTQNKYVRKGVFFAAQPEAHPRKSIDLYNQGCPVATWKIDPEIVKRNEFKIFSTGDAFSIISPSVNIQNAQITIHVGLEHAKYSPLVLLQEALQLCRCSQEHGAKKIIIALPEQYHPALYTNDFNILLMDLFKASGAHKIYFYDKSYKGILDETNSETTIPLILSQHAAQDAYQISRNDLLTYLNTPLMPQISAENPNIDQQILRFSRKSCLADIWSMCDTNKTPMVDDLCADETPTPITVSALKTQPHILISCSANKPLAENIAAELRMHGEQVQVYHTQGKGEQAIIPNEASLFGAIVTIIQSTRPNPNKSEEITAYEANGAASYFFEAAMIARQAQLRGAKQTNLINPYQFSARSDKAEDNPKGKTGAYIQQNGRLFETAGVNHIITAECHDPHTLSGSYTGENIKGTAVPALSVLAAKIAQNWLSDPRHALQGQLRLVTPDDGATKRTKELTAKLQRILGKRICESRVIGDKQRDSHQDDSATVNRLNLGNIGINTEDNYLITDDETATGKTLCQAILNLKQNGAKDISVLIVHNNMPLDWLLRQLCLARFLYLGANDLHFSDTQEMGVMAQNYEQLLQYYSTKSQLTTDEIEKQVIKWFKENISDDFTNKTDEYIKQELEHFKSMLSQIQSRVNVHSLATQFANQIRTQPYQEALIERPVAQPSQDQSHYTSIGSLSFFHRSDDFRKIPLNVPAEVSHSASL